MPDLKLLIEMMGEGRSATSEIGNVHNALAGLEKQAGLTKAGLIGMAVGAGAALGAALIGLGVQAFKLGESFDAAYDRIRIGTGATGERFAELQNDFRSIASNSVASFENIGTAVTILNARLHLTGEPLQALATQVLTLSRITGTDLSENLRLSTRLFGDWGISVSEQSGTLDMLFRATQQTGSSLTNLQALLVQYGAPLRQLGFGFSESAALLAKFEAEGVNTELVMGSLRIALGNLAQAGVPLEQGMRDLIVTIHDMENPTEATSLAIAAFGARAGPDMAAAIREGRFELGDLLDAIETGDETIQGAAEDTEDAAERWKRAMNRVALSFEPVGEAVFALVGQLAEDFGPQIEHAAVSLSVLIKALNPGTRDAAAEASLGIKGVADALAGFISVAGAAIGAAQALFKALQALHRASYDVGYNIADLIAVGAGGITRRDVPTFSGWGTPPVNEADVLAAGAGGTGPHPQIPEAETTAEQAGRRTGGRFNRGLADALMSGGKGGGGGGGAKHEVEDAVKGFMAALQASEATLEAEFGRIGGRAASALSVVLAKETTAGGASVAKAMEDLITDLRAAGVDDWRATGDALAAAMLNALRAKTDEAKAIALNLIGAVVEQAKETRFWAEWEKAGITAAEKVNVAQQEAITKITKAWSDFDTAVARTHQQLSDTRWFEAQRDTINALVQIEQEAQAKRSQAAARAQEDADRGASRTQTREDAAAQHQQNLREINRVRGTPAQEENLRYKRELAAIEERERREDKAVVDSRQRQDAALAKQVVDSAGLVEYRRQLEIQFNIDKASMEERALKVTLDGLGKARDEQIVAAQTVVDVANQKMTEFLDKTWVELIKKFELLHTENGHGVADEIFDSALEDAKEIEAIWERIRINMTKIVPIESGVHSGKDLLASTYHTPDMPFFDLRTMRLYHAQHGVTNFAGGWIEVGETGPELLFLPQGSSVVPHDSGSAAGLSAVSMPASVIVNLTVQGNIVGAGGIRDVADLLSDELSTRIRSAAALGVGPS